MLSESSLKQLANQLEGELRFGRRMRSLYATDASVYRELPLAVAFPRNEADIRLIVAFAQTHKIGIIPRAAGTSLAGQCVGKGLVVDVSKYMNRILEINAEASWVRVQPGVVRDELNEKLKPYGLFFGPNTSTSNRCNIGGMIGNNSCGTTSIVYGSTRDHVLELRTVLSNGEIAVFSDEGDSEKNQSKEFASDIIARMKAMLSVKATQDLIRDNYPSPEVTRRNTGYALDALVDMQPFNRDGKPLNLCSLLCGSEGTLAFTTEARLNLVPLPQPHEVVLAAHFRSMEACMRATVMAMEHKPAACELMDKTILDCTKDNIEQRKNRFFIEGDPEAVLMIEFRADSEQKAREKAARLSEELKDNQLAYALPLVLGERTKSVWALRNAGLGVLANMPGDKKAVACIEDTAVAVKDLPEYIADFSKMMKEFGQDAVYYAHAGAGELHLRPVLDLKKSEDVRHFRAIAQASANLVKNYHGSLSGEHGDGKVRAEFIPVVLGKEVYSLLKEVKKIWDPEGIFNPGKIVDPEPMDTGLRYETDRVEPEIKTRFNFEETGGILRTVEKCNGSGDCRKLNFAGGTMCPSYRVTLDETDTTRGRANVLREFLTMNVKENPFDHPEIKEVLDLCLSCKGCKSECPSNIDMATLKAEFLYQYQKSHGASLGNKLMAKSAELNRKWVGFAGLINTLLSFDMAKKFMGVSARRELPRLQKKTFRKWQQAYKQPVSEQRVYFFIDEFTEFYDVDVGIKAIKLLNALGYEALFVDHPESGRALISKGFLDEAAERAESNVKIFSELISADTPLIGLEPSAVLSFRDEYPNLLPAGMKEKAQNLAENVFLIEEFLARENERGKIRMGAFTSESKKVFFHAHCHQKALASPEAALEILNFPENYSASLIRSGCCGMAGSFGYEEEHYELSMAVGEQLLFPAVRSADAAALISANGTSCRHQIRDGTARQAFHPVEILFDALL